MVTRPVSHEALDQSNSFEPETLIDRLLPGTNADRQDRASAWAEWQSNSGEHILSCFVRAHNSTAEADEDIIQDALLTAYLRVERGLYHPLEGVPFTAYVIGIARNKIREARRRERYHATLDEEREELGLPLGGSPVIGRLPRQPESVIERLEQREALRRGLSRLPQARRQVLEHYLSGASTDEIASQLAMSEALVRQHKCRGLRALQRDMQMAPVGQAVHSSRSN